MNRVEVYAFGNGYMTQATHTYNWLRFYGLKPCWGTARLVDGVHTSVIELPEEDVPILRHLQRTEPQRFGNPPPGEELPPLDKDAVYMTRIFYQEKPGGKSYHAWMAFDRNHKLVGKKHFSRRAVLSKWIAAHGWIEGTKLNEIDLRGMGQVEMAMAKMKSLHDLTADAAAV